MLLPGETTTTAAHLVHGGDDTADAELGALLWPDLLRVLGVESPLAG